MKVCVPKKTMNMASANRQPFHRERVTGKVKAMTWQSMMDKISGKEATAAPGASTDWVSFVMVEGNSCDPTPLKTTRIRVNAIIFDKRTKTDLKLTLFAFTVIYLGGYRITAIVVETISRS